MLVYGWDRPRNGVSRVADNDQQIRAVGTVGGGRLPLHIFTFSLFQSGWVYYAHLIATINSIFSTLPLLKEWNTLIYVQFSNCPILFTLSYFAIFFQKGNFF